MRKYFLGKPGVLLALLGILWSLCGCGTLQKLEQSAQVAEQQWERELTKAELDKTETEGGFAYHSLSEAEQVWYRSMLRILEEMQEKEPLAEAGLEAGLTESCIDRIFQCVLNDHPELFYVEGYTYTKYSMGERAVKMEFSGTYSMDRETAKVRGQEIEQAASLWLAGIEPSASDYEKIKYVYETIICNTDYNLEAEDNQNIYSVFVNRESVCQGYAKATQYLLNKLGIECTMVMGTVDTGEGHAWNLVKADGSYYYVDTTWGDASYQIGETTEKEGDSYLPEINYDYLCVTTEQLLRTHTLGGVVPMPQCVDMENNYYVREGAYMIGYDEALLTQLFTTAGEQGKQDIAIKCANAEVYREMEEKLIGEQAIFDYLALEAGTIAYAQNDKQLSMTFWVTKEG